MNIMCHMDYNNEPPKEYQDVKRCDLNMDAIFKLADEVLPTTTSSCLVTVVSQEQPALGIVAPSSVTCNTMLSDTPELAQQDIPLQADSRSSLADVLKFRQDEDSLLSLSDQIKDYSIFEVIFFFFCLKIRWK